LPNIFVDFLLQRQSALKITKVYADDKINAKTTSISIVCVRGRGQPMLAGGGGAMEPKKATNKKGGSLAIYSVYKILYIS
jgi:hypothetical protein